MTYPALTCEHEVLLWLIAIEERRVEGQERIRALMPRVDPKRLLVHLEAQRLVTLAGARLAAVDERLQRAAVDVVRDSLALEEADEDRVGAGVGRTVGRGCGVHALTLAIYARLPFPRPGDDRCPEP